MESARAREALAPLPQSTPHLRTFKQIKLVAVEAAALTATAQTTSAPLAVMVVAVVGDTAHLILARVELAGKETQAAKVTQEAQAAVAAWAL